MKKGITLIITILTINPLFQLAGIKTGFVLSTAGLMLGYTSKVNASSKKLNPNSYQFFIESGLQKSYDNDYEGAIEDFTKAIELNPDNGDAYYMRGYTKYDLEDYEGAIEDFSRVIGSNVEDPELYFLIGAAKLNLENYEGCSDINKAIELGKADEYDWEWLDSVEANFCSN